MGSEEQSKATMQLILSLKSSFLTENFERVAKVLISREEALASENFELKQELEAWRNKYAVLQGENGVLKDKIVGLSEKVQKLDVKLKECEKGRRMLKRKPVSLDFFEIDDGNEGTKSGSGLRGVSDNREISARMKLYTSLKSQSGDKTPQNHAEKSENSSSSKGNKIISGSSFTKGAESEQSRDKQSRFSQNRELNWESEADMIDGLIEDPFLCMEAVCVLYRLEISQVKLGNKRPLGPKRRGLSGNDVYRCTKMAEFLANGDPSGPAKRSIQELKEHDPFGMEYCHKLIQMYSRHLFEVYKNKEDSYFC